MARGWFRPTEAGRIPGAFGNRSENSMPKRELFAWNEIGLEVSAFQRVFPIYRGKVVDTLGGMRVWAVRIPKSLVPAMRGQVGSFCLAN